MDLIEWLIDWFALQEEFGNSVTSPYKFFDHLNSFPPFNFFSTQKLVLCFSQMWPSPDQITKWLIVLNFFSVFKSLSRFFSPLHEWLYMQCIRASICVLNAWNLDLFNLICNFMICKNVIFVILFQLSMALRKK